MTLEEASEILGNDPNIIIDDDRAILRTKCIQSVGVIQHPRNEHGSDGMYKILFLLEYNGSKTLCFEKLSRAMTIQRVLKELFSRDAL